MPIETLTVLLRQKLSQVLQNLVESGFLLLEAKKILGHGRFQPWLQENFSMSGKTANRFMSVAMLVKKRKLDDAAINRLMSLELKCLYELAAKSTSSEVQEQIFKEMNSGKSISYEYIRFLKTIDKEMQANSIEKIAYLAEDLRDFSDFFATHLPLLEKPVSNLATQSRQELLIYAEKLMSAYAMLEEILTGDQDLEVPGAAADAEATGQLNALPRNRPGHA